MTDVLDPPAVTEERGEQSRADVMAEVVALRAEVAELRARVPQISVREPMTYRQHGQVDRDGRPYGFFHDIATRFENPAAADRLYRHGQEMRDWCKRRDERAQRNLDEMRDARETFGLSYRTNLNTQTGTGGNFTPPAWLITDAATFPRPKRVLANLVNQYELPKGVSSINIPVMTAGNNALAQAQNAAAASGDVTDTSTSCNAVTIAGIGDIAQQLRDMSPNAGADHAWFADLTSAYDFNLEQQLYTGAGGTGIGAQFTGLINVTGKSATAYTDGSPTNTAMYPKFGQVAAHIGNQRGMPPYAWLMRTARWSWLTTGEDSNSDFTAALLALCAPELNGDDNSLCPGHISGWPVWMADAIPQNLTMTSTAVTSGSNNVNVATFTGSGTLNVTSTAGFNLGVGTIQVQTSLGYATITYTGTSGGNSFTGCTTTSGTGTLSSTTGQAFVYAITQGASTSQDMIIACIPSDIYLFEGTPTLQVAEQPLSGDLQVRFVLRNYAAAITGRYAVGVAVLGGTGLAVQANYQN